MALRTVASSLRAELKNEAAVLMSCTKGIEHGTGMRMSEILAEKFPTNPVAVLSGPNLAVGSRTRIAERDSAWMS